MKMKRPFFLDQLDIVEKIILFGVSIDMVRSSRGREVKASDSKSDSLWERRFESCRLRTLFFNTLLMVPREKNL